MAVHNQLGQRGELLAAAYLQQNGFIILHRNWRHAHYEIDLIGLKNEVLHFIEVKMRTNNTFGNPEESVTRKKFQCLLKAADEFLYQHQQYKHVQYDIMAISLSKNNVPEYFFIEDVYL